jgi:hypothetical protein
MANNFGARLDRLETVQRRRSNTGPKLTRKLTAYFYCDDPPEKIAEAHAAGMRVIVFDSPRDEPGPDEIIW